MSIFSHIQATKPQSNTFDLSHDRKMSLDMGNLVPILSMETVPGDKINMSTSQMLRFAPLVAPIMHRVTVYTHFYFVPNRILWSNWEDFITGGEDGLNNSAFPIIKWKTTAEGTLLDYIGLPLGHGSATSIDISAMPFSAYQKIFDEYYRDQNLVTKVDVVLINGDNAAQLTKLTTLRTRAWQHDYFTSALPWTQKGAEATIPLGTTAPIIVPASPLNAMLVKDAGTTNTINSATDFQTGATGNLQANPGAVDAYIDPNNTLVTDLTNATAATINALRNAFRLQEWLEKNARGGSRYIESILSHFGVKSSDARLQRPEFLGGGSAPMTISEVLQTSANDPATEPTPLATQAGHGISVGASNNFSYYCEEHGYIIGIMSILPKTAYQQGVPKHLLKHDKFDYYWPSFAHLGEQPIVNQELYFTNDANNQVTFGYTPRYAEYKYLNSSVHGEFRSTLDFWHMGRVFAARPTLNAAFIESDPTDRIFAVLTGEKIYV